MFEIDAGEGAFCSTLLDNHYYLNNFFLITIKKSLILRSLSEKDASKAIF
jgi:hypothetical protein